MIIMGMPISLIHIWLLWCIWRFQITEQSEYAQNIFLKCLIVLSFLSWDIWPASKVKDRVYKDLKKNNVINPHDLILLLKIKTLVAILAIYWVNLTFLYLISSSYKCLLNNQFYYSIIYFLPFSSLSFYCFTVFLTYLKLSNL